MTAPDHAAALALLDNQHLEVTRSHVSRAGDQFAQLYRTAYAYRQAEINYVFMAERPDEEYVAADVHLARMHMCRAAAAFDDALAAVADKLTNQIKTQGE